MKMFEVGGCVRDRILGIANPKDIDFSVVMENEEHHTIDETFDLMAQCLTALGFEIFVTTPEFLTIRARFPRDGKEFPAYKGMTADFVLARSEGAYSDGRHPDTVRPGTLADDLARRDFTMNAIALDPETGEYIDPHGGIEDIRFRLIRCVGSAEDRFQEDALRAMRALRFSVTKGFIMNLAIIRALHSEWLPPLLSSVSKERKRDELMKMFHADTLKSLDVINNDISHELREAIFCDGLWLEPTLRK